MLFWRTWKKEKKLVGVVIKSKEYKVLLLFGFIPLFIWIKG